MKIKKRPKLHFQQVPLKDLEKLLGKRPVGSGKDAELSVRRSILKTEPYCIPLVVDSKRSR